jgi:hypothetical protein
VKKYQQTIRESKQQMVLNMQKTSNDPEIVDVTPVPDTDNMEQENVLQFEEIVSKQPENTDNQTNQMKVVTQSIRELQLFDIDKECDVTNLNDMNERIAHCITLLEKTQKKVTQRIEKLQKKEALLDKIAELDKMKEDILKQLEDI